YLAKKTWKRLYMPNISHHWLNNYTSSIFTNRVHSVKIIEWKNSSFIRYSRWYHLSERSLRNIYTICHQRFNSAIVAPIKLYNCIFLCESSGKPNGVGCSFTARIYEPHFFD